MNLIDLLALTDACHAKQSWIDAQRRQSLETVRAFWSSFDSRLALALDDDTWARILHERSWR